MAATMASPTFDRDVTTQDRAALGDGRHSLLVGYLLWILGFLGAHRFYYGKPISGTIYFFTLGLLGIGWVIDLFLMPSLQESAERKFVDGDYDYNIAWILLTFLGFAGAHRLYLGKIVSGGLMLLVAVTSPMFPPIGLIIATVYLYDYWTLNNQVSEENLRSSSR